MGDRLRRNSLRGRALRDYRRILFYGDELKIFKLKAQIIDGFKDQIAVLVADVAELGSGHADKHHLSNCVTKTRWLEPGFEGVSINFLFQGTQDAHPWIYLSSSSGRERH